MGEETRKSEVNEDPKTNEMPDVNEKMEKQKVAGEKKRPVSLEEDFQDMIRGGLTYIDKTLLIRKLIVDPSPHYFLARPRRFGKTLLLSTIENIFKRGQDTLFDGLDIAKDVNGLMTHDWETSHVLRINMSACGTSAKRLNRNIAEYLCEIANMNGIAMNETQCAMAISKLVMRLFSSYSSIPLVMDGKPVGEATEPKVVILIDEYDYPLINNIDNPKKRNIVKNTLHEFYSALKSTTSMSRFTLVTGISRFSEFSPHSGMNNLVDISYDSEYSCICGFTEHEIKQYYGNDIDSILDYWKDTGTAGIHRNVNDVYATMMKWYDGYSWDGLKTLLNPVSVINFIKNKYFRKYWYNTGGTNFLSKLNFNDTQIFEIFDRNMSFNDEIPIEEIDTVSPKAALLQTGYLTIGKIDAGNGEDSTEVYHLTIPNYEVRMSYTAEYIIPKIYPDLPKNSRKKLYDLHKGFAALFFDRKAAEAAEALSEIFSLFPYSWHVKLEAFCKSHMFTALSSLENRIFSEWETAGGIIDLVVENDNGDVMVIEVKHPKTDGERKPCNGGSPEMNAGYGDSTGRQVEKNERIRKLLDSGITEAFRQIDSKGYAKEFLAGNRNVWSAAVAVVERIHVRIEFRQLKARDPGAG
ncbi:MAG: AAA family ATPase [Deltaproteobacteria bacterium]|jgi:hypothetical protein|nr:AAA family ATPase [Deltaproteobacteria bacterium]